MIPLSPNMTKEEKVKALKLRKLEELLKQYGVDLEYFKGEVGEKGESIQGETGENGQSIKGDDGYTPIKGVDYFDGHDGLDAEQMFFVSTTEPINPKIGMIWHKI